MTSFSKATFAYLQSSQGRQRCTEWVRRDGVNQISAAVP